VDGDGRVLGGFSPGRPRTVGKTVVETPWAGRFSDYVDFDQARVPSRAEVAWMLPDGAFTYWRARVTHFKVLP